MAETGRRKFLFQGLTALASLPVLSGVLTYCAPEKKQAIKGKLLGPSHKAGHLLRQSLNVIPTKTEEKKVVIIGGGISGLSAARWLKNNSELDFCLLELEDETGGNSAASQHEKAKYPWGAHYLPLPNNDLTELLFFLKEHNVITCYNAAGLPEYNDEFLCFDPEERLFINGHWQEGLIPNLGVPTKDLKQIERFLALMEEMKSANGTDKKFAFTIPVANSSTDAAYRNLDNVSFEKWLVDQGLNSGYLLWYVNYCCRDDFGTTAAQTSAWAGIHYFAARKAKAANTDPDRVLTWPEGNNWLAQKLRSAVNSHIRTGKLVYRIGLEENRTAVDYLDLENHTYHRILADKCILATPQYVNERLFQGNKNIPQRNYEAFSYAPWAVANLRLKEAPAGRGVPLSWDNVIYGSESLGYVLANQQHLEIFPEKPVITFYLPLSENNPLMARKKAYQRSHQEWSELVLTELEKAHPTIREQVKNLDVWIWGHGMVAPTVGFIWGKAKAEAQKPIQDKLYFAHTDLSGLSIFEEAFYQGINAAKQVISGKA